MNMDTTCSVLQRRFAEVRARSVELRNDLSDEDCAAQSMPDASPLKWHLAHTTWFFDTFVLELFDEGFVPFHPAYRALWNSYYQSVGTPLARSQRGLLTRPAMPEILQWRSETERKMLDWLGRGPVPAAAKALMVLGLEHERQHQELMMTDLLSLMALNPLRPAALPTAPQKRKSGPLQWRQMKGGLAEIGHSGLGFAFDNECPPHRVWLEPYALSSSLVTNREYLDFVERGAYREPQHWLAEGWEWVRAENRSHPLYWREHAGQWMEFSLNGEHPLEPDAPACHLSLYEADAYARWRGARLPTEQEWEHASRTRPEWFEDLFGDCWQWTSSAYTPYPGFRPLVGAPGEYNGKFMVNQYVLRGSSQFTAPGHTRSTCRNYFPAHACWQRTGIRLAASGQHIDTGRTGSQ